MIFITVLLLCKIKILHCFFHAICAIVFFCILLPSRLHHRHHFIILLFMNTAVAYHLNFKVFVFSLFLLHTSIKSNNQSPLQMLCLYFWRGGAVDALHMFCSFSLLLYQLLLICYIIIHLLGWDLGEFSYSLFFSSGNYIFCLLNDVSKMKCFHFSDKYSFQLKRCRLVFGKCSKDVDKIRWLTVIKNLKVAGQYYLKFIMNVGKYYQNGVISIPI